MKVKMTRSSGNIFQDLGFTAEEAARLLGVTQPRVSNLLGGRLDLFSSDTPIDMHARLGIRVKLALKPSKRRVAFA